MPVYDQAVAGGFLQKTNRSKHDEHTMNTITDLILPKGRTPPEPALSVRNNGGRNGEFNRPGERHFQLLTVWRNDGDDDNHRFFEGVIGPKKCFTNQPSPVAVLFPHTRLG